MDLYGKQTVLVIRQDENLQKIDNKIDSNVDKTHQKNDIQKNITDEVVRAKELIDRAALATVRINDCMDIKRLQNLTTRALVKGNQTAITRDALQTCLAHWDPKIDAEAVLRLLVLL